MTSLTTKLTVALSTLLILSVLISKTTSTYTTSLQIDNFSGDATIFEKYSLPEFTCLPSDAGEQSQCYQDINKFVQQSPDNTGNFRLTNLFLDVESAGKTTPNKVSTDVNIDTFISKNTFNSISTITNNGSKDLSISLHLTVSFFDYLYCYPPDSSYNPNEEFNPPSCNTHYGKGDVVDFTVNGGNAIAFSFTSTTHNKRKSISVYAVTQFGPRPANRFLLDSSYIDKTTGEYVVPFSDLSHDVGTLSEVIYFEIEVKSDVICCADKVQSLLPGQTLSFEYQIANVRVVSVEELSFSNSRSSGLYGYYFVSFGSYEFSETFASSGSSKSSVAFGSSQSSYLLGSSQSSDASLAHLQILLLIFAVLF